MTDSERNDLLERVLRSYAVGDHARAFCDRVARDPNTTPLTYVRALLAGLVFGNWPWLQRS